MLILLYLLFYCRKYLFDSHGDPDYNPLPEDRPGGFAWGQGQQLGREEPQNWKVSLLILLAEYSILCLRNTSWNLSTTITLHIKVFSRCWMYDSNFLLTILTLLNCTILTHSLGLDVWSGIKILHFLNIDFDKERHWSENIHAIYVFMIVYSCIYASFNLAAWKDQLVLQVDVKERKSKTASYVTVLGCSGSGYLLAFLVFLLTVPAICPGLGTLWASQRFFKSILLYVVFCILETYKKKICLFFKHSAGKIFIVDCI